MSKKVVDTDLKTLYAITLSGKVIGVHPSRKKAREIKTDLGGKKAGYAIIAYKVVQEIR